MSERNKNLGVAVVLSVSIAVFVLAIVAQGATTKTDVVTKDNIGIIDLARLQKEFPAYARLQESVRLYQKELDDFVAFKRMEASNYYADLETKKKAEESAAQSDTDKQLIAQKYEDLARAKALEVNKAIQQKSDELQQKLRDEQNRAEASLREAVKAVSAKKDMKLVLAKDMVYFGGVDMTNDVVAKGKEMAQASGS